MSLSWCVAGETEVPELLTYSPLPASCLQAAVSQTCQRCRMPNLINANSPGHLGATDFTWWCACITNSFMKLQLWWMHDLHVCHNYQTAPWNSHAYGKGASASQHHHPNFPYDIQPRNCSQSAKCLKSPKRPSFVHWHVVGQSSWLNQFSSLFKATLQCLSRM